MEIQKYNKFEKIELFKIADRPNIIKISTGVNSKIAKEKYLNIDKPRNSTLYNNSNVAILTGNINNIVVIDVDLYKNDKKNMFYKTFKNDIKNNFNTYSVKTPNGGFHYYFNYDPEIKQTQNDKYNVDVRSDRGYIMCPPSIINGKSYVVANDNKIVDIPTKLKEWMIINMYNKEKVEKPDHKTEKVQSCIEDAHDINITEGEFKDMLDALPVNKDKNEDFRGSYNKWCSVLRASKYAGFKKIFFDWSKKTKHDNYDKTKNNNIWDMSTGTVFDFMYVAKQAKKTNKYTYKKVPEDNFKNVINIDKKHLGDIFEESKNYVVKSDTGTGKTTSFKKYIHKTKQKFISITSRVSLAYEQYRVFSAMGIPVEHYQDYEFVAGDNIIITPESCTHLVDFDFKDYVIFFDEFDSIINHVLSSDTLKKNRVNVFIKLALMLFTCKQFICTDADISSISLRMLSYFKLDYNLIVNEHQHYENVDVTVMYDEGEFMEKMKNTKRYIFCSDSKTDVEISEMKLKDPKIKIISSETRKNDSNEDNKKFEMDNYDKLALTPAVTYGLDSTISRTVFAHYRGHTISPAEMVQQICRARNIKHVYLYYSSRTTCAEEYQTMDDVQMKYKLLLKNFDSSMNEHTNNDINLTSAVNYEKIKTTNKKIVFLFRELFEMLQYKRDCFKTNGFLHLTRLLTKKKFNINDGRLSVGARDKKASKELKEKKIGEFDPSAPSVVELNKYLKVPKKEIKKYAEYFVDDHQLQNHFKTCKYFFGDDVDNTAKLHNRDDFAAIKCTDQIIKFKFLDKLLNKLKLDKTKLHEFTPRGKKFKDVEDIDAEYRALFRVRSKVDIATDTGMYKVVGSIFRDIFDNTKTSRACVNGERFYRYTVDEKGLAEHKKLYDFRTNKSINKKIKKMF